MSDDNFETCDASTSLHIAGNASMFGSGKKVVICGLRKGHAGLHYDKSCGASWDPAPDVARQPESTLVFASSKKLTDSLIDLHVYGETVDEKTEKIRALRACIEAMMAYVPDTAVGKLITRLALALIDLTQAEMPQ